MWFSKHFPGLSDNRPMVDFVEGLTPEQTSELIKAGRKLLEAEGKERLEHTRLIASAAGMRLL